MLWWNIVAANAAIGNLATKVELWQRRKRECKGIYIINSCLENRMGTVILLPKHHIEHLSETIEVITETLRSDGMETPSLASGEGRISSSLL